MEELIGTLSLICDILRKIRYIPSKEDSKVRKVQELFVQFILEYLESVGSLRLKLDDTYSRVFCLPHPSSRVCQLSTRPKIVVTKPSPLLLVLYVRGSSGTNDEVYVKVFTFQKKSR